MNDLEMKYSATNYAPLPVTFVRGQGIFLYDANGKAYLDMLGAYSAASFGHCHSGLIEAIIKQMRTLDITSRAAGNNRIGEFLARACVMTGMDKAIPMNSGAEAVETAIKLARKWAYTGKGIGRNIRRDQAEIVTFEHNFHGRTTTVVSFSTNKQYNELFGPLTPGFVTVPFGEIDALQEAINSNTAAVLIEPIQGEAGIVVPYEGYLADVAHLCRYNEVLLICDEIQTGMGRTGKLLACEHDHVKPDLLCMGKALSGGLHPVSLVLGKSDVMDVFEPGDHGSTFGGNPIAAAAGFEALQILINEGLIENSAIMGDYFKYRLQALKSDYPIIKEVRGKGLFIGVEFDEALSAEDVVHDLLDAGLFTKNTHRNTIRFAPPLNISKENIDTAIAMLDLVLAKRESMRSAA